MDKKPVASESSENINLNIDKNGANTFSPVTTKQKLRKRTSKSNIDGNIITNKCLTASSNMDISSEANWKKRHSVIVINESDNSNMGFIPGPSASTGAKKRVTKNSKKSQDDSCQNYLVSNSSANEPPQNLTIDIDGNGPNTSSPLTASVPVKVAAKQKPRKRNVSNSNIDKNTNDCVPSEKTKQRKLNPKRVPQHLKANTARQQKNDTKLLLSTRDRVIVNTDSDEEFIPGPSTSTATRKRTTKNNNETNTTRQQKNDTKLLNLNPVVHLISCETTAERNFSSSSIHLQDCPICYEPLQNKPISCTTCGHLFCTRCILQSVKATKTCPTCRAPLSKKKIHPLFI